MNNFCYAKNVLVSGFIFSDPNISSLLSNNIIRYRRKILYAQNT